MTFNSTIAVDISLPVVKDYDDFSEIQPTYRIVIESVLFVLIWITSVLTNILVCVVIYRSRRVQSTTNYFVVSMAFSDLLLTLFCVPFILSRIIANRWVLGSILCRLIRFIQILAPTTTVFVLVTISVDRFYTIIYPLSFKITRGTAKHLISGCWLFSFISSVFSIYFYEASYYGDTLVCPPFIPNTNLASVIYGSSFVALTFVLPAIFVLVVYSRIFRYVWTTGVRQRRVRRTENPVARNKVKMVKMLIIVTVLTYIGFSPHYIVQLSFSFLTVAHIHPAIFVATFLLLFLTTIMKPLIYMMYNSNFRRGCREVFCMSNMRCYRSHTYAITTASNIGKKNHVGVMPVDTGNRIAIQSPTFTFNRTVISEKTAWPVSASISTTYL
ncbi:probable G-protein coupled receptor 19 [Ruditapes philippinarum]|uniref:probable G-protein coupled receptor 19 n=1 Tax=Ruditapes philippinarum TaxID=129788 RepID=UPI00295B37EF|nr:probable G-protein coupled receptor 19 [Ruditapes philippinarum]